MINTHGLIVFQKIIQASTGLITTLLIAKFLSPDQQGFFYTMGSLLNGYVLLDLGLSALIVQKSAKYFFGLKWIDNNLPRNNKSSLFFLSFFNWVFNWYKRLSILILIMIPLGSIYFLYSDHHFEFNWFLPWIIMVLVFSISMPAIGFLSVLEGAKKINQVYLMRSTHYILGAILAWILLASGYGLFAQSAAPFAIALIVYAYIFLRFKKILPTLLRPNNKFPWRLEILPQQKKNSIGWLSNYIFLHTPVPIVFYYLTPIDAGKLGLTMVVANICIAIAMTPITSVTPKISELAKVGLLANTSRLFIVNFLSSVFLVILGTLFFYFFLLNFQHYEILQRMLAPNEVLIIFISFAFFYAVLAFMIFFRAYDLEPLAIPSLILITMFIFLGVYYLKFYGLIGFIYTMLVCLLSLFIYSTIFFLHFTKIRK